MESDPLGDGVVEAFGNDTALAERLTAGLVDWINGLRPFWLRWVDVGSELVHFFNDEADAELLGVQPSGGLDRLVRAVVDRVLPPYEDVVNDADRPHPVHRLANVLAERMVKLVWEETQRGARTIDWPDHVRVVATQ